LTTFRVREYPDAEAGLFSEVDGLRDEVMRLREENSRLREAGANKGLVEDSEQRWV
jgi:hypothetical protein